MTGFTLNSIMYVVQKWLSYAVQMWYWNVSWGVKRGPLKCLILMQYICTSLPLMYIDTLVQSTWENAPKPLNNGIGVQTWFYLWKMYFVTAIFLTEILLLYIIHVKKFKLFLCLFIYWSSKILLKYIISNIFVISIIFSDLTRELSNN